MSKNVSVMVVFEDVPEEVDDVSFKRWVFEEIQNSCNWNKLEKYVGCQINTDPEVSLW